MTQWRVILRPEPSDVPAIHRLRRALKCLLRVYRVRCLEIVEIPAAKPRTPRKRGAHARD